MMHSATFMGTLGENKAAIDGYIRDSVLSVGAVAAGKLIDGMLLTGSGYRIHRILYQIKSTHGPDFRPGSIGDYRVLELVE